MFYYKVKTIQKNIYLKKIFFLNLTFLLQFCVIFMPHLFLPMKKYTQRRVRRKGKLDGRDFRWKFWPFEKLAKESYPSVEDENPAIYEKELLEVGQQEMYRLAAEWKETDKELKSEYCKLVQLRKNAEASIEKETRDVETAAAETNAVRQKLNEFAAPTMKHKTALIWLIIIGIVEFPLNSVAFQIFGAGMIETYILAAGICILLPLIGHWCGRILKQSHKNLTEKILVVLVAIIALGITISLAVFREVLFETTQANSSLKINLSPHTASFMFIIFNLAFLIVTIALSYSSAYNNQSEFNRLHKIYKIASAVLKRELEDAEQASAEKQKFQQQEIDRRQRRQKIHDKFLQRAYELRERYELLVRSYRTTNLYARHKGLTPKSFINEPPKLSVSEELMPENLDWECPGNSESGNLISLN